MNARILKPEYQKIADEFDSLYPAKIYNSINCLPYSWYTHEGNPSKLEATEEAWVLVNITNVDISDVFRDAAELHTSEKGYSGHYKNNYIEAYVKARNSISDNDEYAKRYAQAIANGRSHESAYLVAANLKGY